MIKSQALLSDRVSHCKPLVSIALAFMALGAIVPVTLAGSATSLKPADAPRSAEKAPRKLLKTPKNPPMLPSRFPQRD